MRYEFHPEALDEYDQAGLYYAQRQPGLDLRFIVSVEETIERILDDPYRWRPFDEDVRRCLTRFFLTRFFTPSNPTTSSSSRWRIAVASPAIGGIVSPNKPGAVNGGIALRFQFGRPWPAVTDPER